jgi:hypothetical protein
MSIFVIDNQAFGSFGPYLDGTSSQKASTVVEAFCFMDAHP